jgi:hypothetical protein
MPAGKRVDPNKAFRERQKILKDIEERENIPQDERYFPNFGERIRRVVTDFREYRRRSKNPPPRREGADVIGRKRRNDVV